MPRAIRGPILLLLLSGGLSACSGLPTPWGDDTPQTVAARQLAGTADCGMAADAASLLVFADAAGLRGWAQTVQRPALAAGAVEGRRHAVIAMDAAAGGLAVARDAVKRGNRLTLRVSRLSGGPDTSGASPCVVVLLPEGLSRRAHVELRDSDDTLLVAWPPYT